MLNSFNLQCYAIPLKKTKPSFTFPRTIYPQGQRMLQDFEAQDCPWREKAVL